MRERESTGQWGTDQTTRQTLLLSSTGVDLVVPYFRSARAHTHTDADRSHACEAAAFIVVVVLGERERERDYYEQVLHDQD